MYGFKIAMEGLINRCQCVHFCGDGLLNAHIQVMLVDHRDFKDLEKPNGLVINVKGIWRNNDVR